MLFDKLTTVNPNISNFLTNLDDANVSGIKLPETGVKRTIRGSGYFYSAKTFNYPAVNTSKCFIIVRHNNESGHIQGLEFRSNYIRITSSNNSTEYYFNYEIIEFY